MVGKENTTAGVVRLRPRQIKSRKGCANCKSRRLKCDETSPECRQCTKRGLACPGYIKPLQWVTKYEKYMDPDIKAAVETEKQQRRNSKINLRARAKSWSSSSDESTAAMSPTSQISSTTTAAVSKEPPEVEKWEDIFAIQDEDFTLDFGAGCSLAIDSTFPVPKAVKNESSVEISYPFSPSLLALQHRPTILIEHYFRTVCTIFCCFDSRSNPFRTQISQMVMDSKTIYHAIQGMAAAHMSKYCPEMIKDGLENQNEAMRALVTEFGALERGGVQRIREETILGVVVLGMTSAWYDPSSLGITHLRPARFLVNAWLSTLNSATTSQQSFIIGALSYWEMLASFISDPDEDSPKHCAVRYLDPHISRLKYISASTGKIIPNPWSGIATEIFPTFAKVGCLVRKRALGTFRDVCDVAEKAESVELELLKWKCPSIDEVEDVGDANTPVQHLLDIGEAYRYTALLQLYRGFPELLDKRLPKEDADFEFEEWLNGEREISDIMDILSERNNRKDQARRFLYGLAAKILTILRGIPSNSGTKAIQPILVLQAANELYFTPPERKPFESEITEFATLLHSGTTLLDDDVHSEPDAEIDSTAYWREFCKERILELERYLGLKPIKRIVVLMREVWRRMDMGDECYWLSVMVEKGWETNLG